MKKFEIFFGAIKLPVDFIMAMLAFISAYKLRLLTEPVQGFAKPIDYTLFPTMDQYLTFSLKATALLLIIFALGKLYTLKSTINFSKETGKVIMLCGVWAMLIITYFFFKRTFPFSRLAIIYSWVLGCVFIIIGRALINKIQNYLIKKGIGKRNLIFVGENKLTTEIRELFKKNIKYHIVDQLNPRDPNFLEKLENYAKDRKIDELLQAETSTSETLDEKIIETCDLNRISYRFIPNQVEVRRINIDIDTVDTYPIITLNPTPLDGWGRIYKRIFDLIGSTVAIILFSPIMLITAIAIKLESKGPILFSRLDDGSPVQRVGVGSQAFRFYKFRSMYPNTHNLRYTDLAKNNVRTDGPLVKIKNDPRITKVGKFIRKYSIDELPQLFNVFIGNLSLVGPRPHLPEEVAKYKKHHKFVLTIKPGITGMPQVNGRSDLNFEEEVRLDRYYIENWSTIMDIKIILKTFVVVLKPYKE